jgi:hypothetical protein
MLICSENRYLKTPHNSFPISFGIEIGGGGGRGADMNEMRAECRVPSLQDLPSVEGRTSQWKDMFNLGGGGGVEVILYYEDIAIHMYIVLSPELTIHPIMSVITAKAVVGLWPIFAIRLIASKCNKVGTNYLR